VSASPEQWAAAIERLVAAREAQGLPRHVEDPATVRKLVTLLRTAPVPYAGHEKRPAPPGRPPQVLRPVRDAMSVTGSGRANLDFHGQPIETAGSGRVHYPRWTPDILDAIAPVIDAWRLPVHDPFAGQGDRLGALCDRLGLTFTGTEIEAPFIVDSRVSPGDSTERETYPNWRHCVVTSPAYPNGWADHFDARDGSQRHTYRQALAAIVGHDRPLHSRNMGRHSVRSGRKATARHFNIAAAAVRWWPDHVVVNVSDFEHKGAPWPLVDRWCLLLDTVGYRIHDPIPVPTPRLRLGAHSDARCDNEAVIVATRQVAEERRRRS
jgi:hypothetical protein